MSKNESNNPVGDFSVMRPLSIYLYAKVSFERMFMRFTEGDMSLARVRALWQQSGKLEPSPSCTGEQRKFFFIGFGEQQVNSSGGVVFFYKHSGLR